MGKPHKHAYYVKAWADGAKIQVKLLNGKWVDCVGAQPDWSCNEYRVKPSPHRYRVALFDADGVPYTLSFDHTEIADEVPARKNFVRWLIHWVEVEV